MWILYRSMVLHDLTNKDLIIEPLGNQVKAYQLSCTTVKLTGSKRQE